ncbi:hypothetical protein V1264_024972 [Littorina saxatilis]|uniref:Endonuclease/reverse transcript n=1 Tax=Littorina saxatilis TaxID=31220 RepID=A0AAN9AL56_9CAEN
MVETPLVRDTITRVHRRSLYSHGTWYYNGGSGVRLCQSFRLCKPQSALPQALPLRHTRKDQQPFTRSHSPPLSNYTLHGQTLERVTSTKYLGVILDTKLDFTQHIEHICAKANKTLGFLRRNLKVCSSLTKMLAYKTTVRPILEYACTVWDPHSDRLITTLEKVQRRAARFVTNRYHNTSSDTDMLTLLEWPTLQQRRRCARLAMLHKILNDQACLRRPQAATSKWTSQQPQPTAGKNPVRHRLQKVFFLAYHFSHPGTITKEFSECSIK